MKIVLPLLLIAVFTVTGCSSKKPLKINADTKASVEEELVLNGNSDDNKAGQLRTVYFSYNADELDTTARDVLKNNARYLQTNSNLMVQIEGHCDERGSRQFNLALGERRARAIRDYLKALGIKSFRLKIFSWGSEKPIDERSSDEGWSRNRRGSFVVISL